MHSEVDFRGRRILLTGATGFVGKHVLASPKFAGADFVTTQGVDIRDRSSLEARVAAAKPDYVLHLAAQSFVPRSFQNPAETIEINVLGTLNLLQALDKVGFSGRLLYVSSGDVYGAVSDQELPIGEAHIPAPRNPYAVSKVSAEQLCLQWQRSSGMDVLIARPFNHVGPGQDPAFVIPALASQVITIAKGLMPAVISAGDIDVTRDFTDVRDVVSGYSSILTSGVSGSIYLLCSGVERSVREVLEQLLMMRGIDAKVVQDPSKFRRAEQRRMVADNELVTRDTGWLPRIDWEVTLQDILEEMESKT